MTLFTVIMTVSRSSNSPSLAMKLMTLSPIWSVAGVQLNLPSVKSDPAGRLSPIMVTLSPSGSEAFIEKLTSVFSLTVMLLTGSITGALFTLLTVMVTVSTSSISPSVAMKSTPYVPAWPYAGVHSKVLSANTDPVGSGCAITVTLGVLVATLIVSVSFSFTFLSPIGSKSSLPS